MTDVARESFFGREDPRPAFDSYDYSDSLQKLHTPTPLYDLPLDVKTVAQLLKEVDPRYRTAHLGKWHMFGGGPELHGYDVWDESTGNSSGRAKNPENPKDIFGLADRAISFMRESKESASPFYLQISEHALHGPWAARPETRARYEDIRYTIYAAMTEDLDSGIGMVLDAIKDLGLDDRTYIFYISDNGTNDRSFKEPFLRGGKWWLWEGGIRVPFVAAGPSIAQDSVSDTPVSGTDLLPTILDLAGGDSLIPPEVDGTSLTNLLRGDSLDTDRALYFHYPHYRFNKSEPASAIRAGRYKLVYFWESPDSLYLYDLSEDPSEKVNVAAEFPAKADSLREELRQYLDECGAQLPKANRGFSEEELLKAMSKPHRPIRWGK